MAKYRALKNISSIPCSQGHEITLEDNKMIERLLNAKAIELIGTNKKPVIEDNKEKDFDWDKDEKPRTQGQAEVKASKGRRGRPAKGK